MNRTGPDLMRKRLRIAWPVPGANGQPGAGLSGSCCQGFQYPRAGARNNRLYYLIEVAFLLHDLVAFDVVAFLEVVEIREAHPALETVCHFPGVILEAFEAG